MDAGEWDRAAACTGFVTAFEGKLAKIQSTAWLTYDSNYLYVAFRNFRGPELSFISARARRNDDDAIVYDPANEIWFSPPGSPQTTYQSMFNVYPAVLDTKLIPSVGYSSKAWSGKWEVASMPVAENILYHQVFPYVVDGSVRRPPATIATKNKPKPPRRSRPRRGDSLL